MCSWLEVVEVAAALEVEVEVVALHLFDLLPYPLDRMPLELEVEAQEEQVVAMDPTVETRHLAP
jgi:hypothetical protein